MPRPLIGQPARQVSPATGKQVAGLPAPSSPKWRTGARWYWVASGLLALVLASVAAWWFGSYEQPIRLLSPLIQNEVHEMGADVYFDEDKAGRVIALGQSADGIRFVEMEIALNPARRGLLKEGLVRLTGQRALWLTSEFIEDRAPPLVNGDVVPAVDREEREVRRWFMRFETWVLGCGGFGVGWLFLKGLFRFRRR